MTFIKLHEKSVGNRHEKVPNFHGILQEFTDTNNGTQFKMKKLEMHHLRHNDALSYGLIQLCYQHELNFATLNLCAVS